MPPSFRCKHVLLARSVRAYDSLIDLVGIWTGQVIRQLPDELPDFYVVSFWTGPRGRETDYRLRITSPSSEVLRDSIQEVTLGADGYGLAVAMARGMVIREHGDYRFEILLHDLVQTCVIGAMLPSL